METQGEVCRTILKNQIVIMKAICSSWASSRECGLIYPAVPQWLLDVEEQIEEAKRIAGEDKSQEAAHRDNWSGCCDVVAREGAS